MNQLTVIEISEVQRQHQLHQQRRNRFTKAAQEREEAEVRKRLESRIAKLKDPRASVGEIKETLGKKKIKVAKSDHCHHVLMYRVCWDAWQQTKKIREKYEAMTEKEFGRSKITGSPIFMKDIVDFCLEQEWTLEGRITKPNFVREEEIRQRNKRIHIANVRHAIFYLCSRLTPRSLKEIGQFFGRDHTSVLNSVKKVDRLIEDGLISVNGKPFDLDKLEI